jgi:hypothetical protein
MTTTAYRPREAALTHGHPGGQPGRTGQTSHACRHLRTIYYAVRSIGESWHLPAVTRHPTWRGVDVVR